MDFHALFLRSGCGHEHAAGVACQEPLHQTPVPRQELQQHQIKVRTTERGRGWGCRGWGG